jgi:hypothetical protein
LAGTVFIFGGEIFCLTGPLRYERIVHLSCHTIVYAGIVLVGVAGAMHWVERNRRQ